MGVVKLKNLVEWERLFFDFNCCLSKALVGVERVGDI